MRTFKYCAVGFIATTIFAFLVFIVIDKWLCSSDFVLKVGYGKIFILALLMGLIGILGGILGAQQATISEKVNRSPKVSDFPITDDRVFLFGTSKYMEYDIIGLFNTLLPRIETSLHNRQIAMVKPKALAKDYGNGENVFYYFIFDGPLSKEDRAMWEAYGIGYRNRPNR